MRSTASDEGIGAVAPVEMDAVGDGHHAVGTIDLERVVTVTAVHVEGQLNGPDWSLTADVVRRTTHAVIASGGITSINDLRRLAAEGVSASVIGMALYTGTLDARAVAEEFSQ